MNIKGIILPAALIFFLLLLKFSQFPNWFGFDYDQEINAEIARSILSGKPVLIGPETSVGGLYVGPIFNYFLSLFFLIGHMNPVWSIGANIFIALLTMIALFVIAKKIFGRRAAFLALIIYGFSFELTKYDRILWNPTPMPLVSLLLLYFLFRFLQTKSLIYLLLSAVSLGIAFQLHFTALFLAIFFFLSLFIFSRKVFFNWKSLLIISGTLLIFFSPLILFDARHGYLISNHLVTFFTKSQSEIPQVGRSVLDSIKVSSSFLRAVLVWDLGTIFDWIFFCFMTLGIVYGLFFTKKSRASKMLLHLTLLMFGITVVGFYIYKGPLPSQYALYLLTPFILIFADFLTQLFKSGPAGKALILIFLSVFIYTNLGLIVFQYSGTSLKEKTAITDEIVSVAKGKKVEIVFITSPGMDTGYKYLLWQKGVNYTRDHLEKTDGTIKIVIPKELVKGEDLDFTSGSIGLITTEKIAE